MNDPLLVEVQGEDYWYEGYNMRTGARGIFPAYYAMEITKDAEHFKEGKLQHTASFFLWWFKRPALGLARRERGRADFTAFCHLLGFHTQLGRVLSTVTGLAEDRYFHIPGMLFLALSSSCALLLPIGRNSVAQVFEGIGVYS